MHHLSILFPTSNLFRFFIDFGPVLDDCWMNRGWFLVFLSPTVHFVEMLFFLRKSHDFQGSAASFCMCFRYLFDLFPASIFSWFWEPFWLHFRHFWHHFSTLFRYRFSMIFGLHFWQTLIQNYTKMYPTSVILTLVFSILFRTSISASLLCRGCMHFGFMLLTFSLRVSFLSIYLVLIVHTFRAFDFFVFFT